jgi:NADPH-dependent curcumin reductase CurA
MQGFIVLDYVGEFPAAVEEMAGWIAEGKLKSENTIVKGGLQAAEQALFDLFKGINTGTYFHDSRWPHYLI